MSKNAVAKPTKRQIINKLVAGPKDVDPENNDLLGAGTGEEAADDDTEDASTAPLSNFGAGRLLLRSKQLSKEMTTGKYAGQAVAREKLFGNIFPNAKLAAKPVVDVVPKSFVSDELEIDDEMFDEEDVLMAKRSLAREAAIDKRNNVNNDNEEAEILKRHLHELRVDQEDAVQKLKKDNTRERERAKGVLSQKVIFDYLLKLRIQMQKAVTVSNSLPQHDTQPAFRAVADEATTNQFASTSAVLQDLVADLLDVQHALISQSNAIKSSATKKINGETLRKALEKPANNNSNNSTGVNMEAAWKVVNDSFENYSTFRDDSLENWSRRTKLAGGNKSTLQLKSINLSLTDQIASIMKDSTRLIQRTQVNRANVKVLGKRKDKETNEAGATKKSKNMSAESSTTKATATAAGPLAEVDAEIFDDRDFYQVLLKDLIQDVGAASTAGAAPQERNIQEALSKSVRKSKQDRAGFISHATKGRVIRYVVHPKMVGFMAPVPKEMPETADSLFASLFGGDFQKQQQRELQLEQQEKQQASISSTQSLFSSIGQ